MPLVTSASPHWERLAWQLHPWGRVHPRQACRRRSTLFDLLHEKPLGVEGCEARFRSAQRHGLRSALRGMMRGLAGTSCGA